MSEATLEGRAGLSIAGTGRKALNEQFRVLYAIMLHDIKSRFFGTGLGFVVTIIWPLAHILVVLAIYSGRLVPHGTSMVLYAATATVPFIAANYISRFVMIGMIQNKSFLSYPIIGPLDIMFARCILEIISNYINIILLLAGMALIGINVVPNDMTQAVLAWCAALFLGAGLGIFNGAIASIFPMWQFIYIGLIIISWITCGIGIDPEMLPSQYGYFFSFNPLLHAVEWLREAYFMDFKPHLLDKNYLIGFDFVTFCAGAVLARFIRGFAP